MKKSLIPLLFALAFAFVAIAPASAQLTSRSFDPVTVGRLSNTPDVPKLQRSIKKALLHYGWAITQELDSQIDATYTKDHGEISASISVTYASGGYKIFYMSSKNLNADLQRKTIHRNYVRWIANLDKTIAEEYSAE